MEIKDEDIANASLGVLINYVVAYKLLKYNKPLAIKCMAELDRRRQSGEEINYEDIIENKLKEWRAKVPKVIPLKSPTDLVKLFTND